MATATTRLRVPQTATAWYDSPWRIAGRVLGTAAAVVLVAIAAALVLVPRLLGGASLTVLTGSMLPTFAPGDVVVVRGISQDAVCADVRIGQVVTYLPEPNDPSLITHRVVGKTIGEFDDGTSCRLITQGDANSAADEPVSPVQVRGVVMYGVPKLGWARQWVGDHLPAVGIGVGLVVLACYVWGGSRRPRTRVIAYGGTGPAPATLPAAASGDSGREHDLRLRELEVREREVALREAELALLLGRHPLAEPGSPEPAGARPSAWSDDPRDAFDDVLPSREPHPERH